MRVSADRVRQQILHILLAWEMPPDLAEAAADVMAETDLMGIDSHGISMLMLYESMVRGGKLNLQARPEVLRDTLTMALIDGGANLGHPVAAMAMRLAVDKAAAAGGLGAVGVRNSHHFGALGCYARMAAARGMIGLVTTTARTVLMVPTRGTMPLLCTNPLSFAAPARRNPPFVLDMSSTTVAANKVKVYELNGKPIPAGWVLDEQGEAVTDASLAMDIIFRRPGGGLTPLGAVEETGGHKGYGLALMGQILSATLTGAAFAALHNPDKAPDRPDDIGHFFLAIDPRALRPDGGFEDDLDATLDVIRAAPARDPEKPVLVPGDPEMRERADRTENGIPIPPALGQHIRDICARSHAAYVLQDM